MRVDADLRRALKTSVRSDLIVTQRFKEWIRSHPEPTLSSRTLMKLNATAASTPRDRRYSFSGSSAGRCLREQELMYFGITGGTIFNAQTINIFLDGHWRHWRWQMVCLESGILDEIEVSLANDATRSRGSRDGMGTVPKDHPNLRWRKKKFGFELKGANQWSYQKIVEEGAQSYFRQVARYLNASGLDLYVIVVENKNTQEFVEFVITRAMVESYLEEDEWELTELNQAIDNKQLHPLLISCSKRTGKAWKQCQFGGANGSCERAGDWPVPKIRIVRNENHKLNRRKVRKVHPPK